MHIDVKIGARYWPVCSASAPSVWAEPGPPEPRLKHSILIQSANTTHSQWSELGPATVHSSHGHTLHTGKTGGHTHITYPEGRQCYYNLDT